MTKVILDVIVQGPGYSISQPIVIEKLSDLEKLNYLIEDIDKVQNSLRKPILEAIRKEDPSLLSNLQNVIMDYIIEEVYTQWGYKTLLEIRKDQKVIGRCYFEMSKEEIEKKMQEIKQTIYDIASDHKNKTVKYKLIFNWEKNSIEFEEIKS